MSTQLIVVGSSLFVLGAVCSAWVESVKRTELKRRATVVIDALRRELTRKDADLDSCHDNRRSTEHELSAQVMARRSAPVARIVPTVVEADEPTETTPVGESKSARRRRRRKARTSDLTTTVVSTS